MRKALPMIAAAAILLPGCRKTRPSAEIVMVPSHMETAPAPGAGSPAPAAGGSASAASPSGGSVEVAGVAFKAPSRWQEQSPSSPMRAAQFGIPGPDGGAELAVYYFGQGQGGTVEENAARWQGQFSGPGGNAGGAPQTQTKTVNGLRVTIVTAEGTYSSGMAMGPESAPMPNAALWGVIIEGPQGNVFLKATGPRTAIAAAAGDFDRLLSTIRPAGTSM